jgi:hypothetical protein
MVCIYCIINWSQSIESDTMLELDMQANIMTQIKEYAEEAERLMTEFISSQGTERV